MSTAALYSEEQPRHIRRAEANGGAFFIRENGETLCRVVRHEIRDQHFMRQCLQYVLGMERPALWWVVVAADWSRRKQVRPLQPDSRKDRFFVIASTEAMKRNFPVWLLGD
jgi:hypothetical protein